MNFYDICIWYEILMLSYLLLDYIIKHKTKINIKVNFQIIV